MDEVDKEKRRKYWRDYYARNRERLLKARKAYYERHQDRILEKAREDYRNNDDIRKRKADYRRKHIEKYRALSRKYSQKYHAYIQMYSWERWQKKKELFSSDPEAYAKYRKYHREYARRKYGYKRTRPSMIIPDWATMGADILDRESAFMWNNRTAEDLVAARMFAYGK